MSLSPCHFASGVTSPCVTTFCVSISFSPGKKRQQLHQVTAHAHQFLMVMVNVLHQNDTRCQLRQWYEMSSRGHEMYEKNLMHLRHKAMKVVFMCSSYE